VRAAGTEPDKNCIALGVTNGRLAGDMNLFLSTRSLAGSRREDHLTEFFAAALEISPAARSDYFDTALKEFAKAKGWSRCEISQIETQPRAFSGATCRPDMLLTLSNGKSIACEHKLDAIETAGPECDDRPQLERYLDQSVDGVLFVRSAWKPPSKLVLAHPKYIRPANREHFLWRDFFHLFRHEEPFLTWLREGFQNLGFTPPHPSIGELEGPDDGAVKTNKQNFAKLWNRTLSLTRERGWYSELGGISELYLTDNKQSIAYQIWVRPKSSGLLVRVTPRSGNLDLCSRQLDRIIDSNPLLELEQTVVARRKGKVKVLDITCSLADVLGCDQPTAEEMEARLCKFVERFLGAVE